MRVEGSLLKWDDERGFGFIMPAQGSQEIFVHISAFPKDGIRPTPGEKLTFEIDSDSNGKVRAINLLCPTRPPSSSRPASHHRKESHSLFGRLFTLLVLFGIGMYSYSEYSHRTVLSPALDAESEVQEASSAYRCDGRTHCSQMTSCAEATYFLRHCPNVQMDGNNDGVPCEQQWCTAPFAE